MMFNKITIGIFAFTTILFTGCETNDNRGSANNPPVSVSRDMASLNRRITKVNRQLFLKADPIMQNKSLIDSIHWDAANREKYNFILRAEVEAPAGKNELHTMQATHVAIDKVNQKAFVSYNTRGELSDGMVDIFDISDLSNPRIVAQYHVEDLDISSVAYYNGRIYIAGASQDYKKPDWAVIQILEEKGDSVVSVTRKQIGSYVATDLTVTDEGVYIISGTAGNLVFYKHTYTGSKYTITKAAGPVAIADARSLAVNGNFVYVLDAGEYKTTGNETYGQFVPTTTAGIRVFDKNNLTEITQWSGFGAQKQFEAKTELDADNNYIFSAWQPTGLLVYNKNGTVVQTIPGPQTPTGGFYGDFVTNSATINGRLLMVSNGGAGASLYAQTDNTAVPYAMLGSFDFNSAYLDYFDQNSISHTAFDARQSVNFMASEGNVIFVATGLGGLKIIEIVEPKVVTLCNDFVNKTWAFAKYCETKDARTLKDINGLYIYKQFFDEPVARAISVTQQSDLYITFVSEGAGMVNSLGYYLWDRNMVAKPTYDMIKADILSDDGLSVRKERLVYSRIRNNQNDLVKGYTKYYLSMKPNIGIGFFLIPNGGNKGFNAITGNIDLNTNVKLADFMYTHFEYNQSKLQQHMLYQGECNSIVLSFEDIQQYGDHDYNDIIFILTDNPNTIGSTNLSTTGILNLSPGLVIN